MLDTLDLKKEPIKKSERFSLFLERSFNRFGNFFDLCQVEYVNTTTPITIVCPHHGAFRATPDTFIHAKHGCSKCADTKMGQLEKERAKQKFLINSPLIHDFKYDYSRCVYIDAHTRVLLGCPQHGDFWVTPTSHMNMQVGCPICAKYNQTIYSKSYFDKRPLLKSLDGVCYLLKASCSNENYFAKIGITQLGKSYKNRLRKYKTEGLTIHEAHSVRKPLYEAYLLEQDLLKRHADNRIIPIIKFSGWTECLSIHCWEQLRQELR
jgi:hypothetical protein